MVLVAVDEGLVNGGAVAADAADAAAAAFSCSEARSFRRTHSSIEVYTDH